MPEELPQSQRKAMNLLKDYGLGESDWKAYAWALEHGWKPQFNNFKLFIDEVHRNGLQADNYERTFKEELDVWKKDHEAERARRMEEKNPKRKQLEARLNEEGRRAP